MGLLGDHGHDGIPIGTWLQQCFADNYLGPPYELQPILHSLLVGMGPYRDCRLNYTRISKGSQSLGLTLAHVGCVGVLRVHTVDRGHLAPLRALGLRGRKVVQHALHQH